MERPSHSIATLSLQSGARRFAGAGIAVFAQAAFIALLIGGVAIRVVVNPPPPLEVAKIRDTEARTPPPPIKVEKVAMPTAVTPLIDIAPPDSGAPSITTVTPQPPQPPPAATARQTPPPAAVPDHGAIAIAQTHSVPAYPTLARRLGAEGKVTLRLTVLPDGTVGGAEVVTSSGRHDLDEAARQWIMAHWTYQPAIRGGAPAASQVMAAVEFTLTGGR